jgi:hypothetical protein
VFGGRARVDRRLKTEGEQCSRLRMLHQSALEGPVKLWTCATWAYKIRSGTAKGRGVYVGWRARCE